MQLQQENTTTSGRIVQLPSFFRLSSDNQSTGDFEEEVYTKGQIVFRVDTMPHRLYYVKSGRVKVFKYGSDGKEQILTIARSGQFLGYKDLLAHRRYTSGAIGVEDVTLVFIPKTEFLQIFKSDDVSGYFTGLLCRDLMDAEERMVSMAYKPVRGRLAESLLNLSKTYKGHEHGIELTRGDLANFVGTAKETVIRLLSEFRSENLIRNKGTGIEVVSETGLNKVLRLYR